MMASHRSRRLEMVKRSIRILLLVGVLTVTTAGAAFAQGNGPDVEVRRAGVILSLDFPGKKFTLRTLAGGDLHVLVTGATTFRSPQGEISGFDNLEQGMRAVVRGELRGDGTLQAAQISAALVEDLPQTVRVTGEIRSVDASSFVLAAGDGRSLSFEVVERTAFRSRDGSIQSLADLEPGMQALVVGVQRDGAWTALIVAAGNVADLKERAFKAAGEISSVVPGQSSFTLDSDGTAITFQVSDRTRFRSRDGSVASIHDLKQGMQAHVVALETEQESNLALLVAAGYPVEHPERARIDVRAAGRITGLGDSRVTIETRHGESKTFVVDADTVFRSRQGSVSSFSDLEPGMIALVRGTRLEDGMLLARWIGAGEPPGATRVESGVPPSLSTATDV